MLSERHLLSQEAADPSGRTVVLCATLAAGIVLVEPDATDEDACRLILFTAEMLTAYPELEDDDALMDAFYNAELVAYTTGGEHGQQLLDAHTEVLKTRTTGLLRRSLPT